MTMGGLAVVITAKDESVHIGRCIASVAEQWTVVVVDGGSTDDTVEIARAANAHVLERRWTGYADQKNWALDNLPCDFQWVLFLDADEEVTPALRREIAEAVEHGGAAAYAIPRRYIFLGKELRHAWWYPDYQIRLLRKGHARFEERLVHEHPVIRGRVDYLQHALIHNNRKGLEAFVERHNRYSGLEATERVTPSEARARGSFRGDRLARRRAIKERVWYRMPFRPALRFWWLYAVKRGFLDGRPGWLFCRLLAQYEFLIDAKGFERRIAQGEGGEAWRADK